jgi:hypothetical protein
VAGAQHHEGFFSAMPFRFRSLFLGALLAGAALLPTAVSAQEVTYPTRNGPRTFSALSTELQQSGYAGPWDIPSMVAAYNGANGRKLSFDPDGTPRQQCSGPVNDHVVIVLGGPSACDGVNFPGKRDLSYGEAWPAPYALICVAKMPRNKTVVDTEMVIGSDPHDQAAIDACNGMATGLWDVNWLNNANGGPGVTLAALA